MKSKKKKRKIVGGVRIERKKDRVRVGTTTITSITSPRGNQEADERGGARGSKEVVGAKGGRKKVCDASEDRD